ncbi:MAG TPA: hypothetical protein VKU44_03060 [Terriglobia bacterium]|nr:hypothetical protein [Terriglobia bacterium]
MKPAADTWAYRVSDLTLTSNVALPELPPGNGSQPQASFHLASPAEPRPEASDWFHRWTLPSGADWLAFARHPSGYLLRFPDLGDFLVSTDGISVRCYPAAETPIETIRHLFLDQVLPLVLSRLGRLVVHSSAVLTPAGAVAFVGSTGQGKSTLALSFAQQGFPFLADDCLLLEEQDGRLVAVPSYPGLRLWPETVSQVFEQSPALTQVAHYSGKQRLGPASDLPFSLHPAPVARVYFLAESSEASVNPVVTIEPLSPKEALLSLVRYAYLLDMKDREVLREKFDRLGRLAGMPLFYRLAYQREFTVLPQVRQAILHHLEEGKG